jgi:hypothetical protein
MCSDRCRDISLLLTLAVKVKDVSDTKTIALALHDCRFPYKGASTVTRSKFNDGSFNRLPQTLQDE